MSRYEWTSDHVVGVEQIDAEHRGILGAIRDLETALSQDASAEAVQNGFDRLITLSSRHFESEEKLLAERNYPHLEAQKIEHEVFRMNLNSLAALRVLRENGDLLQLLDSIFHWWENHILTEGMKIKEYFAEVQAG